MKFGMMVVAATCMFFFFLIYTLDEKLHSLRKKVGIAAKRVLLKNGNQRATMVARSHHSAF